MNKQTLKQISLFILLWFGFAFSMPDLFHHHEAGEFESESCPVYFFLFSTKSSNNVQLSNPLPELQMHPSHFSLEFSSNLSDPPVNNSVPRAPPASV